MMVKELKAGVKKEQLPSECFLKKNINFFFGGKSVIYGILLFAGVSGNLIPAKSEG
jgi:hypothetical protein